MKCEPYAGIEIGNQSSVSHDHPHGVFIGSFLWAVQLYGKIASIDSVLFFDIFTGT